MLKKCVVTVLGLVGGAPGGEMGGGVGGVGTNVPDGGQIFFGPGDRSGESSPRVEVRGLWPG